MTQNLMRGRATPLSLVLNKSIAKTTGNFCRRCIIYVKNNQILGGNCNT